MYYQRLGGTTTVVPFLIKGRFSEFFRNLV
jgi:hypothetical protein